MRAVIYYPHINPPQQWIKQSLLYWDRISSIVPADFDDRLLHPDLIWLRDLGKYEPVSSDALSKSEEDLLAQEIVEYLHFKKGSLVPQLRSSDKKETLYYGKLPRRIEAELCKAGLLKAMGNHLETSSEFFGALLCMIAKYLANTLSTRDNDYSMFATDLEFEKVNFEPTRPDKAQECIQILLKDLLPVPAATVSLEQILDFKNRHDNDLCAFRAALDSLSEKANAETPISRVLASAKDQIAVALEELRKSLRSRFPIVAVSLSILCPALVAHELAPHLPSLSSEIYLAASATAGASIQYLVDRVRPTRFDRAFSYVELARLELGAVNGQT